MSSDSSTLITGIQTELPSTPIVYLSLVALLRSRTGRTQTGTLLRDIFGISNDTIHYV